MPHDATGEGRVAGHHRRHASAPAPAAARYARDVRVVLLVNERSGSGSGPSASDLQAMLVDAGARVERLPVDRAARAAEGDPDRIVVAGGDGSIAPAADAAGAADIPLAVVPSGTANDFARRMGLPDDPRESCRLAVRGERLRTLDLGRMDGRPFVNVATAGLSVMAARSAGPLKGALGPAAYFAGAVRSAVRGRPLACAVRCDGREVFSGPAWQVMVACSGAFGAGSRIAEADPGDGLLDVVALAAGSRLRLVRHARALRAGMITDRPGVHADRGARIELSLPPGASMNVDGELVDSAPAYTVEPGAFRLVVA